MEIELRWYEKKRKDGLYSTRRVLRMTDKEVYYKFETKEDGYQTGVSTVKAFKRWMKGTEQCKTSSD